MTVPKTQPSSKSGSRFDTTNEEKLGEGRVTSIHHSGRPAASLSVCITIHVAMDAINAMIVNITITNPRL